MFDKMEDSDTSFFPNQRTLTLEAHENKEKADDEKLSDNLKAFQATMARRMEKLEAGVEGVLEGLLVKHGLARHRF